MYHEGILLMCKLNNWVATVSLVDVGRRHETPGSETKDLLTAQPAA